MSAAQLSIIGLGPGHTSLLAPLALASLESCEVLAGYGLYVDMVPEALRQTKEILVTGMRHEQERCQAAIQCAVQGKRTALVCSGDAGIYGMSGLVLELLEKQGLIDTLPVEIIPGIPAVCAAAALLGAPLMHDFACISLSDLLTPWEKIIKRLHAALEADFVVVLYNPRSRGRKEHLQQALDIAKQYRAPQNPLGHVRNAYRENQEVSVHELANFKAESADMLSTIVIGNSQTQALGRYMVTPRGYNLDRLP